MILLNYLLVEDKTDPNTSTNKKLNNFLPPIVAQPQPLLDDDEYNLNNDDNNNKSKLFNIDILLDYYNNQYNLIRNGKKEINIHKLGLTAPTPAPRKAPKKSA